MDDTTILGGIAGQLGQAVKQSVKQVVKIPEEMAADAGGQVGVVPVRQGSGRQAKLNEQQQVQKSDWKSDEERMKFLRDLYGKSDMPKDGTLDFNQNANPNPSDASGAAPADKKLTEFQEQIKDKSPEEQKELMELRDKLHKENYYDPTFNPVKNPPAGREKRPAEKVENEKKQEMADLQQKDAKKPPPLAVIREQNKAEMFRGAAG